MFCVTFSASKNVKREFMCKKERQTVRVDTAAVGGITSFSVDHVHLCLKNPNFLNSAPTSTEGALRLLSAPGTRF
jgi:hypothetical protein